jgi:hypothetical protein
MEHGRHRHAAHRGEHGKGSDATVSELTVHGLALDLEADDEDDNRCGDQGDAAGSLGPHKAPLELPSSSMMSAYVLFVLVILIAAYTAVFVILRGSYLPAATDATEPRPDDEPSTPPS